MEKIVINNEACIGCGACTAIAGEVFEFNDEGYAEVIKENSLIENMNENLKNDVIDAIEGCPTSAIEKIKE